MSDFPPKNYTSCWEDILIFKYHKKHFKEGSAHSKPVHVVNCIPYESKIAAVVLFEAPTAADLLILSKSFKIYQEQWSIVDKQYWGY